MADLYFSTNLTNERLLCIAPLSDRKAEEAGSGIGDPRGYFLYECGADGRGELTVIARVLSEDAALRLKQLLGME